jgi:quercetin dioxygenase-like cupin family protein
MALKFSACMLVAIAMMSPVLYGRQTPTRSGAPSSAGTSSSGTPSAGAPASGTTPASGVAQPPAAPGRGGQSAGSAGDPDPGVHFIVILDNPSVRVLQVTLQPGAVRRDHVHNDVTFHMLVPVTGSLEVTAASLTAPSGRETFTAVPGQAYYMVKGQPHGFVNKTATPVQVIEVFVKGEAPTPWPVPFTPTPTAPRTP